MENNYPEEFLMYLNMLHTLSISENAQKTQDMLQRIVKLVNYRHFRRDEVVTVTEELDHVHLLVGIFKQRFGNKLDFLMVSEGSLEEGYLPHYSILAFIENALYHGLEPKEGEWRLELYLNASADCLSINIIDNGVGFDVENTLYGSTAGQNDFSSINWVLEKLHSHFKGMGNVKISSQLSKGTKIQITLPA